MKINRLIFPMVLALAAMVAATGCKHGFTKVTNLPGQRPIVGGSDIGGGTLPPAPAFPDTGLGVKGADQAGGGPTVDSWDPANMNQDRAALAANTVHFKFDSAVVLDNEQANVSAVASALAAVPSDKLLIEGHCDERGTEEYNRALGERRALALREALAKAGVSADRVRTISYGKDKPVDLGHDEAAWAKNRRGEFVLCHPK